MKKTLTLLTLLTAGTSQAAGFAIDTQSGRATGMGTAVTANTNDASSIYYNPAGLLHVDKLQVELGASLILPNIGFTPTGGAEQTQSPLSPPPYLYFAYKLMDQAALGVGVFVPFGANSQWPEDFVGRFLAQESRLATYDINPSVAYAPWSWLRLGAGVQVVYGTVDIQRQLNLGPTEGTLELSGNGWGFGFNAGVQADVVKGLLTLGAHYRSEVKQNFDGDADFSAPAGIPGLPPDQPISSTVRLPATLGLGVSVKPLERLTVAFDAYWWRWSSFEQLVIEFEENPLLTTRSPKNWRDVWNFHLGAEYGVTEALALRLGFVYDPTPSPEETLTPELPDFDRIKGTVGVGYAFSSFRADLGYQFVYLREQESTFPLLPGTYQGTGHVFGLTLGYSM